MTNLTKEEMVSYGLITNVDMASSEASADDMVVKTKVSDVEAYEVIYEEADNEESTTDPVEPESKE